MRHLKSSDSRSFEDRDKQDAELTSQRLRYGVRPMKTGKTNKKRNGLKAMSLVKRPRLSRVSAKSMAWLISIRTLGLGIGFRSADVCFKSFPGRRASLGLISRELAAQTAVYLF